MTCRGILGTSNFSTPDIQCLSGCVMDYCLNRSYFCSCLSHPATWSNLFYRVLCLHYKALFNLSLLYWTKEQDVFRILFFVFLCVVMRYGNCFHLCKHLYREHIEIRLIQIFSNSSYVFGIDCLEYRRFNSLKVPKILVWYVVRKSFG